MWHVALTCEPLFTECIDGTNPQNNHQYIRWLKFVLIMMDDKTIYVRHAPHLIVKTIRTLVSPITPGHAVVYTFIATNRLAIAQCPVFRCPIPKHLDTR